MKERNFKLSETVFEATKFMDDKTAGKFFKSIGEYAFNGKVYDGNDVTIKTNFLLVKRILDGQARDKAYGKIGAERSMQLRKQQEAESAVKQAVIGCGIVGGLGELLQKLEDKSEQ